MKIPKDLHEVERTDDGLLVAKYFLNLLQFIHRTASEQAKTMRTYIRITRRQHFKQQDWIKYSALINESLEAGEEVAIKVERQILKQLNINKEELDKTYHSMMANAHSAESTVLTQVGLNQMQEQEDGK